MRRWLNRAGWLLSAGTIVTALTLLPLILERPELDWLEWLGVVGNLVGFLLLRLASPSTPYLAAAVVSFFANMLFVALLLGVIVHLVEKQKKRTLAQL